MKKNYTVTGTMWKTKSVYVDKDTGEEITKWNAQRYYITIQKDKHVTFNYNKTIGTIEITNICIKQPQGKLF